MAVSGRNSTGDIIALDDLSAVPGRCGKSLIAFPSLYETIDKRYSFRTRIRRIIFNVEVRSHYKKETKLFVSIAVE